MRLLCSGHSLSLFSSSFAASSNSRNTRPLPGQFPRDAVPLNIKNPHDAARHGSAAELDGCPPAACDIKSQPCLPEQSDGLRQAVRRAQFPAPPCPFAWFRCPELWQVQGVAAKLLSRSSLPKRCGKWPGGRSQPKQACVPESALRLTHAALAACTFMQSKSESKSEGSQDEKGSEVPPEEEIPLVRGAVFFHFRTSQVKRVALSA